MHKAAMLAFVLLVACWLHGALADLRRQHGDSKQVGWAVALVLQPVEPACEAPYRPA